MATFESLTPHIYLLLETRSKHFDSPDDVKTVGLHVNGISSVFTIFLPTSELSLALLTEQQLLQWVELVEGDVLRGCDLNAGQHDLVVTLIRAYRACYFQLVSAQEIGILFRLVVEAAMALDDHEPADDALEELVGYINEAGFPMCSL
ncbi:hypothetical protein GSI_13309 [Ganoderma sinense ZZ0214-1]|uniref:Uncharacterized protein n=1 Tax=Ganoderma sinense ZZ0214-1 TaxID=1077348 RepID=A0A2G8RV96_9APHY|nr:hypothetical protein GSI_13309 [Ganoderma sinense ZZ0214-1]